MRSRGTAAPEAASARAAWIGAGRRAGARGPQRLGVDPGLAQDLLGSMLGEDLGICWRIGSPGFSALPGSWKIIAMWLPRIARIARSDIVEQIDRLAARPPHMRRIPPRRTSGHAELTRPMPPHVVAARSRARRARRLFGRNDGLAAGEDAGRPRRPGATAIAP